MNCSELKGSPVTDYPIFGYLVVASNSQFIVRLVDGAPSLNPERTAD